VCVCVSAIVGARSPGGKGALWGVILGHAQTCPRSIFDSDSLGGSSDAAFGYTSLLSQLAAI